MKYLALLLLLLPLLSVAQAPVNPIEVEDFRKDTKKPTGSLVWDDHLNIMQIDLSGKKFEVAAINDKMKTVWSVTLDGAGVRCARFRDKVLALSKVAEGGGKYAGFFVAYLIDPQTGKVTLHKVLDVPGGKNLFQVSWLFDGSGNQFAMVARETAMSGNALTSMFSSSERIYKTANLVVINYDEKLEPRFVMHPAVANELVLDVDCNKWGDIFVFLLKNNRTVEVTRYQADSNTPYGKISQDINFHKDVYTTDASLHIKTEPSKADANVVYFAVVHKNPEKGIQLSVARMDFGKKASTMVTEVMDKKHIKELTNSLKLPKGFSTDLGSTTFMEVGHLNEYDGELLLGMSDRHSVVSQTRTWVSEGAMLLNKYDKDFKLKFQQILPTSIEVPEMSVSIGYYKRNQNLHLVTNKNTGQLSWQSIHGVLDLASGQWVSLTSGKKDEIPKKSFAEGDCVLWFKDSLVLPFVAPHGLFSLSYDVHLQQLPL